MKMRDLVCWKRDRDVREECWLAVLGGGVCCLGEILV
jgi:hypothetical protein